MSNIFSLRFFLIAIFLGLAGVGIFYISQLFTKAPFTINSDRTAVIKELKELQRLETTSFTIEKIIEGGTNGNMFSDLLYGDRILLIAHGQVIAGFDLQTLEDKDIEVKGKSLIITLPAPQILVTSLDNAKTRVYDRRQGILSKGNKDLESEARLAAEESIRKAACEGNILTEASTNGRKQLTALFSTVGFTSVTVNIPQGACQ